MFFETLFRERSKQGLLLLIFGAFCYDFLYGFLFFIFSGAGAFLV